MCFVFSLAPKAFPPPRPAYHPGIAIASVREWRQQEVGDSQAAAQAMGVSILKYRLTAFVTATVFATVGGVLYAVYIQNAPTTAWTLDLSLFIIAMVVVGGFKSIYGTFLGAFIIHGIPNLILADLFGDVSFIFSGVLIILVILFYPYGAIQIFYDIRKWYYKLRLKWQRKGVSLDE